MQDRLRLRWILTLGGVAAVAVVLGVVWAVAPEDTRGMLMLAGGALTAAVYVVLYAIQRRRHWVRDPADARRRV